MGDYNPTESRYRGERRPMPFFKSVGGKNRSFKTNSFTDTRDKATDQSYPSNYSLAGSYASADIDNAVFGGNPKDRASVDNLSQQSYNKAYGPGSSSSRPPLDKARNKLAKRNQNLMNSRRNKGV